MAKEVGIKTFRTYTDAYNPSFSSDRIEKLSKKIQEWYQSGCANMDLENVYIGSKRFPEYTRPLYESFRIDENAEHTERTSCFFVVATLAAVVAAAVACAG